MNLFVLSELGFIENHVGWLASYDIEEVLAQTCNPTFIYPQPNNKIRLLKRYRHRIFKSWFKTKDLPTLGSGPNVLLVVGMTCDALLMMLSLGPLLKKFDLRLAYLFDLYDPQYIDREASPYLDYLFIPVAEVADEVNEKFGIKSKFLPHAFNALNYASNPQHRCIDVISYGRGNLEVHKCLQENFNQSSSPHIYFHSTFSHAEVESYKEHRMLLSKLLSKSKISLCFEPTPVERFNGYSPLLTRWFEGWAAGCTIVGKRPFGKNVADLINWTNSTIEIPDNSSDWLPFFEDLLGNHEMLLANSERNYRECLLRHDWRYRLRDIFKTVDLPIPEKLDAEILQLQEKAHVGLPC